MALLSPFDGVGIARVALDVALRRGRCLPMLHTAWFVEIEDHLAEAVESYWDRRAALTGEAPYRRLAGDVWDIVRDGAGGLRRALGVIPCGSLLFIVAGSP
eukprot:7563504-Alexandrium_andersonii.AAC.1